MKKYLQLIAIISACLTINTGCRPVVEPATVDKGSDVALNAMNDQSDTAPMEDEPQLTLDTVASSVLYLEVYDDQDSLTATASGFLIDDQTLVTNYHVIEDAYSITAWTENESSSVQVNTVLAYDEAADLAVLRCEDGLCSLPLEIADSDTVQQGDAIYAIGYPLGIANTLSDGIISSRYTDDVGVELLQITAAISSGSSGGPLIDAQNHVVGVICATYVNGQNLNIAIASNVLTELLEKETAETDLAELYNAKSRPIGLDYVLENRKELAQRRIVVKAYISSTAVLEMDGERWVDYILVGSEDDVFGYIGYGYDEAFFEDEAYQYCFNEYENERTENYLALVIEFHDPDQIFFPGDAILVEGTVDDVIYIDEAHDVNWHHVLLRDPQIVYQ